MLHPNEAHNLIKCDEYTLRWLTGDGLQTLKQSRRETSSSSTDDDLDHSGSVEMALVGPIKAYDTMNCREFRRECEE